MLLSRKLLECMKDKVQSCGVWIFPVSNCFRVTTLATSANPFGRCEALDASGHGGILRKRLHWISALGCDEVVLGSDVFSGVAFCHEIFGALVGVDGSVSFDSSFDFGIGVSTGGIGAFFLCFIFPICVRRSSCVHVTSLKLPFVNMSAAC